MLQRVFFGLCSTFTNDTELIGQFWSEIQSTYTSGARYYHNLAHLHDLLGKLADVRPALGHWEVVVFGIFYHDIVYDPLRADNEEASALFASNRLIALKTPSDMVAKVCSLIRATATHRSTGDPDIDIFLDADLSILGADKLSYRSYTDAIRKEYAHIPDAEYVAGRRRVLERLLSMPSIFKTAHFAGLEQRARINIAEEIKACK